MKLHPVISFIIAFLISGLILSVVFVVLFFLLAMASFAGGETLQDMENLRIAILLIAIILVVIAVMIGRRFTKTGRKSVAYGISVLPVITLVIVGVFFCYNINYHTEFDTALWGKDKRKPFNMAATLVKEDKLIGLTRQEVKKMLGEGDEEYGNPDTDRGAILYLVEEGWTMTLYFQKDKVVEAGLRQPLLGV